MVNKAQEIEPFQLWLKHQCIWLESKFDGRLNRARYFLRILVIGLLNALFVAIIIYAVTAATNSPGFAYLVGNLFGLPGIIACAAQIVKRLHDLGRPSSHYWLMLIPFYNIYLGLLLIFKKGNEGVNEFGADPLSSHSTISF